MSIFTFCQTQCIAKIMFWGLSKLSTPSMGDLVNESGSYRDIRLLAIKLVASARRMMEITEEDGNYPTSRL